MFSTTPPSSNTQNLDNAYEVLCVTLEENVIFSGLPATKIAQAARKCFDAAQELGLNTLDDIAENQYQIVRLVTGTKCLTRFTSPKQSKSARKCRDCLLGALLILQREGQVPSKDPRACAPRFPSQQRTDRPLRFHEELLFRIATYNKWEGDTRGECVAIRAALLACGAYTSETTQVAPAHANDPHNPTQLNLKGANGFAAPRTVSIPQWVRPILEEAFQRQVARYPGAQHQPVAYTGSHSPGSNSASAAASTSVRNLLDLAGLAESGVKPHSVRNARILTVLKKEGLKQARIVTGTQNWEGVLHSTRLSLDDLLKKAA